VDHHHHQMTRPTPPHNERLLRSMAITREQAASRLQHGFGCLFDSVCR
jgi:hypothetical protein